MNRDPRLPPRPGPPIGDSAYVKALERIIAEQQAASATSLERSIEPMNLEQLFFVLQALRQMAVLELGPATSFTVAAACLAAYTAKRQNTAGWSTLDGAAIHRAMEGVALALPWGVMAMQRRDLTQLLLRLNALHAARPVTKTCCSCGSPDLAEQLSHHKTFCYCEGGTSGPMQLIFLKCKQCGSVHHLDGYIDHQAPKESAGERGSLQHPKRPYPAELQHPKWFQSTVLTVFDRRLFQRFDLALLHSHSSFNAFCAIENGMRGNYISPSVGKLAGGIHMLHQCPSFISIKAVPQPFRFSQG